MNKPDTTAPYSLTVTVPPGLTAVLMPTQIVEGLKELRACLYGQEQGPQPTETDILTASLEYWFEYDAVDGELFTRRCPLRGIADPATSSPSASRPPSGGLSFCLPCAPFTRCAWPVCHPPTI